MRIKLLCSISLVALLVGTFMPDALAQELYCQHLTCGGSCPGPDGCAYLIGLPVTNPVTNPITNETELADSIPNAIYVEKFLEAEDHFLRWYADGSIPCSVFDSLKGGNQLHTGSDGSGNACFAVNPGEGYVVVTSAPSDSTIRGTDGTTTLSLDAVGAGSLTGMNLVSLPFCPAPTMTTALDLMNAIGFSKVENVSRYLCGSDVMQVYTGRKTLPSTNFPLKPGEAYFVKMTTTTNYATQPSATCVLPLCNTVTATYVVSGTRTTSTFAFQLNNGSGSSVCFDNCAPLSTGTGTAADMAADFRNAINAKCGGLATATATGPNFTVTVSQTGPARLVVGTGAGQAQGCANASSIATCDVNATGSCTFNPTVSLVSVSVPAFSTAGITALLLLMAGGLVVWTLRRTAY